MSASKASNDRTLNLLCDDTDCLSVTRTSDREASLDHIDTKARKLLGYFELLSSVESDSGRLFPVPQRCIEDDYSV
jgi:hypothetical protein